MSNGEREFRLRPGKPHVSKPRHGGIALAIGFKMLMHYARQSSARRHGSPAGGRRYPHRQRCAVRITYSKNTVRGHWRAHGRYLEREIAAHGETGFDTYKSDVQVSRKLQDWQTNKDQLIWKFIIPPEFGERADLQRLTRELMLRVNEDLGGSLEWVAVVHRNTEHPHVHIALRGQAADGRALRLSRDYVKRGVREVAEDLCTRQLGFRTALDTAEAERREIPENRVTSLDRLILRNSAAVENGLAFTPTAEAGRAHNHHVAARLIALSRMGLAQRTGNCTWLLRTDTEQVLRAMQRAGDRQKTLFAHGELVSDKRLGVEAVDWQQIGAVEGRVLTHGEEHSGKNYLMLESTAARVYYIPYTREMEERRSLGGLKPNSFVRLRRRSGNGRLRLEIEDYGHAEAVLSNRRLLREKAEALRRQDVGPSEDGWGGWLGRYQKAICAVEPDLSMLGKDNPGDTIQSVEYILSNLDKVADDQQSRVIRIHKKALGYQAEPERPVEYVKRPGQLLARQAELIAVQQDFDKAELQGADSTPELKDDLDVSQNPPAAEPSRDQVAKMAEAYMRASKTAIREMPIAQRTPPQTGPVTGRVVAKDDEHIAVATAANSFFVVPVISMGRTVEIGERLSLRFQRGLPSLEDDRGRSR